jgi:hypothetical protein
VGVTLREEERRTTAALWEAVSCAAEWPIWRLITG